MFHGQSDDFGSILFYLKLNELMYNSPKATLIRSINAACQFVVVTGVDPMPSDLLRHRIASFLSDERGSQTIEFILWIPVIVALMITVIDAATLYLAHAEMETVARDTARRMMTGQINGASKVAAEGAAVAYASQRLSYYNYPHTVTATWDPDNSMIVKISTRVGNAVPFGYLITAALPGNMDAQVVMRGDPSVSNTPAGGGNGNNP
jgi:Flp pilus assembly protein TadG